MLRWKEPQTERPYKVTGYPVTSLIFSAVCAFLVYQALTYAALNKKAFLLIMATTLVVGLVIYLLTDVRKARPAGGSAQVPAGPQNFA